MRRGIIFLMVFPTQASETESLVLFLDDMEWRHKEFRRVTENLNVRVVHVYSADEAITELKLHSFVQVFLDHDLSEEDIMVDVSAGSVYPTGMAVVDHILTMESPSQEVIVHSCNGPAAAVMHVRLDTHRGIRSVKRTPFPELLRLIRP